MGKDLQWVKFRTFSAICQPRRTVVTADARQSERPWTFQTPRGAASAFASAIATPAPTLEKVTQQIVLKEIKTIDGGISAPFLPCGKYDIREPDVTNKTSHRQCAALWA
ncbi:MAG: hypothetical protein AB7I68_13250 [Porticoccaceae bacterium]